MSDEEFVKEISAGKLYLGKLIAEKLVVNVESTQKEIRLQENTYACVRNIRKVLIMRLLRIISSGYLRLDSQDITLEVTDWWDEAPVLGRSFLGWYVGLKYNNTVFKDDAPFAAVRYYSMNLLSDKVGHKDVTMVSGICEGKHYYIN